VFECVVVISEGSKVIVGDVGVVVDVFFFFGWWWSRRQQMM